MLKQTGFLSSYGKYLSNYRKYQRENKEIICAGNNKTKNDTTVTDNIGLLTVASAMRPSLFIRLCASQSLVIQSKQEVF